MYLIYGFRVRKKESGKPFIDNLLRVLDISLGDLLPNSEIITFWFWFCKGKIHESIFLSSNDLLGMSCFTGLSQPASLHGIKMISIASLSDLLIECDNIFSSFSLGDQSILSKGIIISFVINDSKSDNKWMINSFNVIKRKVSNLKER